MSVALSYALAIWMVWVGRKNDWLDLTVVGCAILATLKLTM